jgi:hypothetical protein
MCELEKHVKENEEGGEEEEEEKIINESLGSVSFLAHGAVFLLFFLCVLLHM